jgi:hypothetical protein
MVTAETLTDEEIRGLQLILGHLDDNGHDWRAGSAMADVAAARAWITAINARKGK